MNFSPAGVEITVNIHAGTSVINFSALSTETPRYRSSGIRMPSREPIDRNIGNILNCLELFCVGGS